jgi:putative transposase
MWQRHPIQADEMMFITTNTRDKLPVFHKPAFAREACEMLYRVQKRHPFLLYGFVIMPDHCHFLLHVPDGGSISRIMRVYKSGLAFNLGIGSFWQSRFHIGIPDSATSVAHYIHQNPVKAGLAEAAENYPWSSASGRWPVAELG